MAGTHVRTFPVKSNVPMRGKIACSAQRLSLLDPQMVQSVVSEQAYQVGQQYRTENRVRIVEADDREVSSVVIGNSGVYQLTIQLKDGALTTKCSCPLNNEQPLCRHAVAVLLEYHRWTQARASTMRPPAKTPPAPPPPLAAGPAPISPPTALDVKLSDVTLFIEWLQGCVQALGRDAPLPSVPPVSGEASTWVRAVQDLDDRRRQNEQKNQALQLDLDARDAHVGRLTEQLERSMGEAKTAQAQCEALRREVAAYESMHGKLAEIAKTVEGLESEIRRIGGEAMKPLSQLNGLAGLCQDAAAGLHQLTPKP